MAAPDAAQALLREAMEAGWLPGTSGYEVARTLRGDPQLSGVLLVALTGYALPEHRSRAASAGLGARISKPPDLPQPRDVLTRARPDARAGR